LKGEGEQKDEADDMRAKMRPLCRYHVVVALLLCLAAIISTVGCATSSVGSYRSAFKNTNEPKYNQLGWIFDIFNGNNQKVEIEDWENDRTG
jgi:hypothetical protein